MIRIAQRNKRKVRWVEIRRETGTSVSHHHHHYHPHHDHPHNHHHNHHHDHHHHHDRHHHHHHRPSNDQSIDPYLAILCCADHKQRERQIIEECHQLKEGEHGTERQKQKKKKKQASKQRDSENRTINFTRSFKMTRGKGGRNERSTMKKDDNAKRKVNCFTSAHSFK